MLDEKSRSKLRELADAAPSPELDGAAQDRIVAALRARGPSEVARGTREIAGRRTFAVAGAIAVAAAISLAWWIWGTPNEASTGAVAGGGSGGALPSAPPESINSCGDLTLPGNPRFEDGHLDLGAIADVTATDGTEALLASAAPCALQIDLTEGSVRVHARNLLGGELRIHTDLADAVVHGTRFEVTRDARGFTLVVDEGTVGVEQDGHEVARVTAGQRWSTGTAGAPPATEPEAAARPAGGVLLGEARALKTRGDMDAARDRYRRAGVAGQAAAWLELGMLETSASRWTAARDAFAELRRRGGSRDPLIAEAAASAELRMERRAGSAARARELAEEILRRWPNSAAAAEARRALGGAREER